MKSLTLRIYIYFISGMLIAALFSIIIQTIEYKKYINTTIEQSLSRGAIAAENIIDPVQHKLLISNPGGRETSYYKETLEKINLVREISNFAYIYTLVKLPDGSYYFIFDTEDYQVKPGDKISYNRKYDNMPREVDDAYNSRLITITEDYYMDEWGTFKSAFLPVIDRHGNVEFILGVDYDATYIASLNRKVGTGLLMSLCAALPFILLLVILLKKDIVTHVKRMSEDILLSEKENLRLKNYLSNIIESMPSMLVSTDSSGNIIEWNMAAENSTGIKRETAYGRNINDTLAYFNKYFPALQEVREYKIPREYRRQDVSGNDEKYLDILIYPLIANGIEGTVIKIDDVTEIEMQQRQLIQSQKLESLGVLAGGIAHDFNNVLGGIIGAVSLLKMKIDHVGSHTMEEIEKYIGIIDDASIHGRELALQLLTLARRDEARIGKVDVDEIIRKTIEICRSTFESTISIDYEPKVDEIFTEGDKNQLEQVLMNLCINGYHAMTLMRKDKSMYGGRLGITLGRFIPDEAFIKKHASAAGNYLCISIKDTGVGIPLDKVSRIFEPFFSTKAEGGSGLGLFIVATIIERHKGFLEVKSETGAGTEFSVFLPELCEYSETVVVANENKCIETGSGLIIVADDQDIMRITMKMMLEQCGFDVIQAENGEIAVSLAADNPDSVKGVILDLVMPGISGVEAAGRIKLIKHEIRTLIVTGYNNKTSEINSGESIDGFLIKPFTFEDMMEALLKAGFFD